jgi:hypothetical protein
MLCPWEKENCVQNGFCCIPNTGLRAVRRGIQMDTAQNSNGDFGTSPFFTNNLTAFFVKMVNFLIFCISRPKKE